MGSHRVGHDWSDLAAAAATLGIHSSFKPGSFALKHWYVCKLHQPQWKDGTFHLFLIPQSNRTTNNSLSTSLKNKDNNCCKLPIIHHIHYQLLATETSDFSKTLAAQPESTFLSLCGSSVRPCDSILKNKKRTEVMCVTSESYALKGNCSSSIDSLLLMDRNEFVLGSSSLSV